MKRVEFITKTYLKATGKPTPPPTTSRKYEQLVELGKFYTEEWQDEPGIDWGSLYDFRETGTITATDLFELESDIRKVSQQDGDFLKIVHLDSSETNYEIISADRLNERKEDSVVAVAGRRLIFPKAFIAKDPQFGGKIVAPSYGYATFPTSDNAEIPVSTPNWLVVICAAEFVRNDIVRQNQYPNLVAEATVLMDKMKENEGVAVDEIYRPNFFLNSLGH